MKKNLTKSELEIMQYIWSVNSEVTAREIREHFKQKNWSKQSVTLFLRKLVDANFLNVRKESSYYYYSASMTEQEYSILPAKDVLKNIFDDSYNQFFCALLPRNNIEEDVRLLEEVLSELKKRKNDSFSDYKQE